MLFQKSSMLDVDENNLEIGGAFQIGVNRNKNPTLPLHRTNNIKIFQAFSHGFELEKIWTEHGP